VAKPNNTKIFAAVPPSGVVVARGPTMDGRGRYTADLFEESPAPVTDVAAILRQTRTDVVVSYLPVGSHQASEFYAGRALEAGCALVNCIPFFVASSPVWRQRFEAARLPVIGDDVKSQVGATIVNRVLVKLFRDRGVRIDRICQLNVGGNADFLNMLERDRVGLKKVSKTQAIRSQLRDVIDAANVHVGPSDYVAWLGDRKWAHIRIEGTGFGNVPLNCELKLEVWDSPNSAGVVIDAVRCAKLALDRGMCGPLVGPSSYLMKAPPIQFDDDEARQHMEDFIEGRSSGGPDICASGFGELPFPYA
jgi:myo-inositol-1-phosphate synthase